MPELPEAETIARHLHERLAGGRVERVVHLRPDVVQGSRRRAPRWLSGGRVARVGRRAKRPIVYFAGGRGIIFCLGMTGRLTVNRVRDPVAPHTHFRMAFCGRRGELRFTDYRRFGSIQFFQVPDGSEPPELAELGVEPLEMTAAEFRALTSRRRQIKALLLDQRAIAGLGNIYCDEALHRAGIHPLTSAAELDVDRTRALYRAIRQVLRASIRAEGTTVINFAHPGGSGRFQHRLRVYGRAGEPCGRCRTAVVRIKAAGRSTHLCPRCQARRG